jgi:hypothetical protein
MLFVYSEHVQLRKPQVRQWSTATAMNVVAEFQLAAAAGNYYRQVVVLMGCAVSEPRPEQSVFLLPGYQLGSEDLDESVERAEAAREANAPFTVLIGPSSVVSAL